MRHNTRMITPAEFIGLTFVALFITRIILEWSY